MKWKEHNAPSINMVGDGTIIKGELQIKGDFRIDGKLIGNVECGGKLTIGITGYIEGEIKCKSVEVSGTVNGNIKADELVLLKDTANFLGDVSTVKLGVDAGAKFTGKSKMIEPIPVKK